MLPAICRVKGVERIRDGGSFAATFESTDSNRYILFLKIRLDSPVRPHRKMTRYDQPVLIGCDPSKRPPNTAHVIYSELSGPYVSISWSQTRGLLEEISKLVKPTNPLHTEWLQDMIYIAPREGLPI